MELALGKRRFLRVMSRRKEYAAELLEGGFVWLESAGDRAARRHPIDPSCGYKTGTERHQNDPNYA